MRADIHDGRGAKRSLQRAEYRCARSIISRSSHPACTARPVHTKYMAKRPGPPSQGWRTFLRNHAPDIAAMDLFVVPTVGFDLLYVFVIVRLDRRQLVWINVTTNPTAEWIARQLTEGFPGTRHHATSSGIKIASMATSPRAEFALWAYAINPSPQHRLGRTVLPNG